MNKSEAKEVLMKLLSENHMNGVNLTNETEEALWVAIECLGE